MKTKITFIMTIALVMLLLNVAKATIHTVTVANFAFSPSVLNINSGDTVKWVWVSGTHTTTSTSVPAGATTWDNPMTSSSTQFEIQLTVVGTYSYHCSMHPTTMLGTINVATAQGLTEIKSSTFSVNAYPVPFSTNLSISFTMPETGAINISIYDVTGQLVKVIADQNYEKGSQVIIWDGKNESGVTVNNGLYFYMIEGKNLGKTSGKIIFSS